MSKRKMTEAVIEKWKKDALVKAVTFSIFFEQMEYGKIYSASDHPILKEYGYVYAWKIANRRGGASLNGISEANAEKLEQ